MTALRIPPTHVPPEQLPAVLMWKSKPAQFWLEGDLLRHDGQIWRIRRIIQTDRLRLVVYLYPTSGGRPRSIDRYPQQWGEIARGV